jgi:hypothetical protein
MDNHTSQRLLADYVEFLTDYDTIGSFAKAHGLTHRAAVNRLDAGMVIYRERLQNAHIDTLAATGIGSF